jgi:ATP-dependent RNA helicase DeaD
MRKITMTRVKFDQLGLSKEILKAIEDMGFEYPSAIQAETIPTTLSGRDIVGQAPTGTGKTAAYAIPIVQKLVVESKELQALILCPTRELAVQVGREFEKLTKYIDGLNIVTIYGGQQIDKQLSAMRKRPQVVIATPGRLMDHLRRASVDVTNLKMVVLDEADEMLDMGFRDDINTILLDAPVSRQTILFSATMARNILELTRKLQRDPVIIDVTDKTASAPKIEQFYFEVAERNKSEVLARLLDLNNTKLALVFCNTKSQVDTVVEFLKSCGYFADSLHGDLNQNQRDKVMNGFRKGRVEILVATDVAGRGIDVNCIEAVFNYDLPRDDEDYIHRIGRTARAGNSGVAYTFISKKQVQSIRRIERANGSLISKKEIPSASEIEKAKTDLFSAQVIDMIKEGNLGEYVAKIEELITEEVTLMDIAAALLKSKGQSEKKKFNDSHDLSAQDEYESDRGGRGGRGGRGFGGGGGRSYGGGGGGGGRGYGGGRDRDSRGGSGGNRSGYEGRVRSGGGSRSGATTSPGEPRKEFKTDFNSEFVNKFNKDFTRDSDVKREPRRDFKRESGEMKIKETLGEFARKDARPKSADKATSKPRAFGGKKEFSPKKGRFSGK